jgi:N-methylhydantoinase A/oxoprolinase/acetone carboxylase beta subunit
MLDEATGETRVAKVPTSRPDQSAGFLAGIQAVAPDMRRIASVVHGTTAGTNALLERKGARIGIITTAGFRDVLVMRRRDRPRTWGLRGDFTPIVPRDLRLEVDERTLADGAVLTAVNISQVQDAARRLLEDGCLAVAVLFVNAYANPENEDLATAAIRQIWPNDHVSSSSDILPEIREFERFSTTALNAYLQPEVSGYLHRLASALQGQGFDGEFLIVQSNGGVMTVDMRADFVQTVNTMTQGADLAVLTALMQSHFDAGQAQLNTAGVTFAGREAEFSLDMAYVGQTHTVPVALPVTIEGVRILPPTPEDIAAAFERAYLATYGRLLPGGVTRILNLRSAITGIRPKFDLTAFAPSLDATLAIARRGSRRAHLGGGWVVAAIWDRLALPLDAVVKGPAILEQPDTTIVIEPGLQGRVDAWGNLILTRTEAAA